jgi:hypothetical protein
MELWSGQEGPLGLTGVTRPKRHTRQHPKPTRNAGIQRSTLLFFPARLHRGAVQNCYLGAFARIGLARAYAAQGDTKKAAAAYQKFLTLWSEADPEIPILRQAKQESAKLH